MRAIFEQMEHFNIATWVEVGFQGYPPMFHSHGELIMVVSGKIDMVIDGIPRTVRAGEIAVAFPYVTHLYHPAPDAEAIILLFDTDAPIAFESSVLGKKPEYPYTSSLPHLEGMFRRIIKLREGGGALAKQTTAVYLSAIIGEILMDMPQVKNDIDTPDVSKKILAYCSEHFADEDISVKKITEALYISPSYVSKVFSNTIKYNVREYVNILRVNRAKKLLEKKDKKIVGIMMECGFKSQSSFNRIFREMCGVTPKEYREANIR